MNWWVGYLYNENPNVSTMVDDSIMEDLKFGSWVRFEDVKDHADSILPGVYLLAHYDNKPINTPEVDSQDIIYIGETTSQTIRKRLYQFSNSAFFRKIGHSGGWTYSDTFLNSEVIDSPPLNLYVSFFAVDFSDPKESKAYIKYIERLAIWRFYQKNKTYPICNKS